MSNEIDLHVIQTTQEMLGKHIKKPPLTEKLLRKPPFRFLHDLVTNVIRETGFLKGLYNERELVSENVKDKEDKIAFLNKLIEAIKTITGMDLNVKPSKIVAGFEPLNTNLLLQAIGTALTNKLDSSKYVNELKAQKNKNKENVKESKPRITKNKEKIIKEDKKNSKINKAVSNQTLNPKPSQSKLQVKRAPSIDSTEVTNDKKSKTKSQIPTKQKSVDKDEIIKIKIAEPQTTKNLQNEDSMLSTDTMKDLDSDVTSSHKLSSGLIENIDSIRPHFSNSDVSLKDSGIGQDSDQIEEDQELTLPLNAVDKLNNSKKTERVEETTPKQKESKIELSEVDKKPMTINRPKSSVRPISVRPSSARPGAPRLQKNDLILMKDKDILPIGKVDVIDEQSTLTTADDEETVTIEAAPEIELQTTPIDLPADKGHLVEQILQQINTSDIESTKTNLNVEWEQAGLKNRNAAIKEVEQLKSAIQDLTKMVNPLGKLINYLHEDIEAMHSELDMWNNYIRQTMVEISNQKKIRNESNKPLQMKLDEIEENIVKHQQQIISTYSDIIRNEERIQDLLTK